MADWILVIVRLSWIFSSMDSDKMGCCRSSATTLLSDVHISDDLGVLLMLGDGTDLKTFFWKIEMPFFLSEYWIASICSLLLCWYHTTLPEMVAKQSSMGKLSNTKSCCFSSPYSFILQGYDVLPYFILTGTNLTSPRAMGLFYFLPGPESQGIFWAPRNKKPWFPEVALVDFSIDGR